MKLVKKDLTSLEWQVYNYLKQNHVGQERKISMENLALRFDVSKRDVRQIIYNIVVSSEVDTIVAMVSGGYYIPKDEEEALKSNQTLEKRIKSSLTRYYANSIENRDWIYNFIRELEEKYSVAPQNQTVIKFGGYEKDINHFGERKNQKAYSDLFETIQS